jgi:hypothetical protein
LDGVLRTYPQENQVTIQYSQANAPEVDVDRSVKTSKAAQNEMPEPSPPKDRGQERWFSTDALLRTSVGSYQQCIITGTPLRPNARNNNTMSVSEELLQDPAYDPDNLLDSLIAKLGFKNDAALSRALEIGPPVISKIRHRRLPVGASLLIRMHEVSELSIKDLRILMGDRRNKFRMSDVQFKPKSTEPTSTPD